VIFVPSWLENKRLKMQKRKANANKDRGEKGGYAPLYYCVIRSQSFANLSAYAVKLLNDLLSQYYGVNNGDLCATFSMMQKRGWKSKGTLNRAIKELIEAGFIEVSRQGGRHLCSLYAVTFYAVDECKGKLDILPTNSPKSLWRKNEPLPDISTLQKRKKQQEDAKLFSMLVERTKRAA
jgi:DNA-binding transcriptional ArsR family regulator